MSIQITCPKCGKKLRLPENFLKPKGICPKCNHTFKLEKQQNPSLSLYDIILLNSKPISQYGKDLSKLYSMIKSQLVRKKEFDEQKQILRNNLFSDLIKKSININSFELNKDNFIALWKLVLELLPIKSDNVSSKFISNLYPRYEFACFISLSYLLCEVKNKELVTSILIDGINNLNSNSKIKDNLEKIIKSADNVTFIPKCNNYLEFVRNLNKTFAGNSELNIKHMSEEFGFGISWIAFHIDK